MRASRDALFGGASEAGRILPIQSPALRAEMPRMSDRLPPAIRSSREHEPALEPEIDAFVFGLGELVDSFQDAELAGARTTLERLAARLIERAEQLGFAPVAESARRIRAACEEKGADAMRKAVSDLTEVAQRVRRGHRSAAV
jgi:hypothetical protein